MIMLSVNLDGALHGVSDFKDVKHASEMEVSALDGGMNSGKPSVTIHMTIDGVGDTASRRHIVGETSARLFCTAARMIMAKYPDLFDDE